MSLSRMNGVYVSHGFGRGCSLGSEGEASCHRVGQSALGPVACSTPITHVVRNTPEQLADANAVHYPDIRHAEHTHVIDNAMHDIPSNHSAPVHAT